MNTIRYVDIGSGLTHAEPPKETELHLAHNERIVSVETIKDSFGYVWMRVWIVQEPNRDSEAT